MSSLPADVRITLDTVTTMSTEITLRMAGHGFSRLLDAVTDPADVDDEAGKLELGPQAREVHIQGPGICEESVTPEGIEDLFPCHYGSCVPCREAEVRTLLRSGRVPFRQQLLSGGRGPR